jgi:hypothetical protein
VELPRCEELPPVELTTPIGTRTIHACMAEALSADTVTAIYVSGVITTL